MKSMTGHGRAQRPLPPAFTLAVELSAVNRRGGEVALQLPREWAALEGPAREMIQRRASRGRVTAFVQVERGAAEAAAGQAIDREAARRFHAELLALRGELGLGEPMTLDHVLRGPGVLREDAARPALPSAESAWPIIEETLGAALEAFVAMRAAEGGRLADDFRARLAQLGAWAEEIAALQPGVAARYREALHERLRRAAVELPVDDERLAKEIALFADRVDISEELTRLRGHLEQFHSLLEKDEPVGRTLDFLAQEMARECNTLSVKANDLALARLAVAAKAEVEKIREQAQNVE